MAAKWTKAERIRIGLEVLAARLAGVLWKDIEHRFGRQRRHLIDYTHLAEREQKTGDWEHCGAGAGAETPCSVAVLGAKEGRSGDGELFRQHAAHAAGGPRLAEPHGR